MGVLKKAIRFGFEDRQALRILQARPKKHFSCCGRAAKNACDKMDVKDDDGETKTYYFEANKVFGMENKMFGK